MDQLSLALVLICHSSLRGIHEVLRDLFDCHQSVGSIHNTLKKAIAKATSLNAKQNLSRVLDAALDELFQNSDPILAVVDVASTYCCLLRLEEQRDANPWGIRLLETHSPGLLGAGTL